MRTLRDFLYAHKGETAWIFGKGPSLDRFPMEQAGPLRCAINDVVRYVPECRYGFANDSVVAWKDVYSAGQILFQPLRLEHDIHAARCSVPAERILFADDWDDSRAEWSREKLAETGLAVLPGTLGSAVQILHVMGVSRIVCVGIDGGGKHAAKEFRTRLRRDHAQDYNRIRDGFIDAASRFGIEIEFFGVPDGQNANGLMKLRITHACFAAGVPLSVGEVRDFPPGVARELIIAGRAVVAPEVDQKPIEAAPAPAVEAAAVAPVAETASAKRAVKAKTSAKA